MLPKPIIERTLPADNEHNLLYCNNNPNPENICAICAADIGRVFVPGTEPHVPRHEHCYCYYIPSPRNPPPGDPPPEDPPPHISRFIPRPRLG